MVRLFCCSVLSFNKWVAKNFISGYQKFICPYLPPSCRFNPSCSEYTKLAIMKYGVLKGVGMGIARLGRCQPFVNYSADTED